MNSIEPFHVELEMFSRLAHALAIARQKRPVFARDAYDAFNVIHEELVELHDAISKESEERQIEEAVDVAVTAMRFILGEHKKK